jgi:hypothetical protein
MGQAKARINAIKKKSLEMAAEWDFPPSQWEADVCEELRLADKLIVPRVPEDQLNWMRMKLNKCHANTRWYEANDPTHASRSLSGWWVQWPDFVLHSVIDRNGELFCITPSHYKETEFLFIPDHNIKWDEVAGEYIPTKNGQVIKYGVRLFPEFTMARIAVVRERINAGIDPRKAAELSIAEIDEMKRKFTNIELARRWNPEIS